MRSQPFVRPLFAACLLLLLFVALGCRPAWSSDGQRLLYPVRLDNERVGVALLDLGTGRNRILLAPNSAKAGATAVWGPDDVTPLLVWTSGDLPKAIVDPAGLRSVSHVTVVERRTGATLIRVKLETGRTHQIRAHLAAVGHPLLGDERYGDRNANDKAKATFGTRRTLLHGERLTFPQPTSGAMIEAVAAHEVEFVRMFPKLRTRPVR